MYGKLWRDASAFEGKARLVSVSLDTLRATLASEIAAVKSQMDEIVKRREALSQLAGDAAPNRSRILRMLGMLSIDRRNLGPSDPAKVSMAYGTAALGYRGELLKDPAYAKAYRTIEKYQLEASYRPLIARLEAKNVDASHLIDLIVDSRTAPGEAQAIAFEQGLGWKLALAAGDAASAASQKEIEDYLGGDNFAEYKAYGPVLAGQYFADQFQQHLSYAGTGMTADQYEKLSALVANGSPQNLLEGTMTDESITAAQGILTPSQFQVLQEYLKKNAN